MKDSDSCRDRRRDGKWLTPQKVRRILSGSSENEDHRSYVRNFSSCEKKA